MSKQYREIKLTPQMLGFWADSLMLFVVNIGTRVATKRDIDRVKKLVLAEYSVDGKKKYRVVYGAGLVSAILYYIASTSEKEKATQAFKEFMRYEFTAFVVGNDNKKNDYLFEVFKGLNRKG